METQDRRTMRIALPVSLIREMDAVILQGIGGYATRAEFIVDAIHERVLELTVAEVEDAGTPSAEGVFAPATFSQRTPGPDGPDVPGAAELRDEVTVGTTILTPGPRGFELLEASDLSRPEGATLFGLHNRDFPSLWALTEISKVVASAPVSIENVFAQLTERAWEFGESLLRLEHQTGVKRTALFPTNREKRKSAELGFRTFAIGDYQRDAGATYTTRGPLFEWRVIGLLDEGRSEPSVALTDAGWSLVEHIDGISIDEPHPRPTAAKFLMHLRTYAPADYEGFVEIARSIGPDGATRAEVLQRVAEVWPDWTNNEVSTNSAGYIARAREWGLVEPKQTKARYNLTALGQNLLDGEIS